MKITGNWQIAHIRESRRFLLYADAYLKASQSVCFRMRDEEPENTWPNAAVAMMLAAHATELFLKGAIVSREPEALVKVHRIAELAETYVRLFPEVDFAFDIPFQSEYVAFSEDEIAYIKKNEPAPSVLFRYPIRSQGVEWLGLQAFEPQEFLRLISELSDAFVRIGARI